MTTILESATVLVVDDEQASRYALVRHLHQAGHKVFEAATGSECLRLTAEHKPELVLLDIKLPDISGIEVCRQLKSDPITAHIPIIHVSAYLTTSDHRVKGLESGADAYLITPFEPRELLAQAHALLRAARAEAAARDNESRFRALVEPWAQAIWETDANGTVVADSPSWRTYTGQTLEEWLGSGWVQAIHPDDREEAIRRWLDCVRAVRPVDTEFRLQNAAGAWRWTNMRAAPLLAPNGSVRSWVGMNIDITNRKQAEEALRQSEQRLALAQEAGGVGVYDWNVVTGEIIWTPELEKIYGMSAPEEHTERRNAWLRHVHSDDRPRLLEQTRQWLESAALEAHWEYRYVRPDGQERWIAGRSIVLRDAENRPLRVVGTNIDITERKQVQVLMEQALEKAELEHQRLAVVLEALPAGVAIADVNGKVTHCNAALSRIWGNPPIPESILDYVRWRGWSAETGEPLAPDEWAMAKALRTGKPVPGDVIEIEKFDGSGRATIINAAAPLRDAHGRVIGGVVAEVDITAQKQAEAALRQAEEQLRRHSESLEKTVWERTVKLQETIADLEEFSYSISHDMRAPLRTMNSFATFLLEEYTDRLDSTASDYLRRIASAAQRLDELIRDVLTYSQVAKTDLTLVTVNLDQLVSEIIESYPNLHEDGVNIDVVHPLLSVSGNLPLVTQCVSNLLSNAVKFVAPGKDPDVRVWTEATGQRVRFCVRDNGIGIETAWFEKIWRVFERQNPASEYPGTGIGLSIVKRAAERMGGSVGVESQPGQGSTFWFELKKP